MAACKFITPKIGENKDNQTQSILWNNILDRVKNVDKTNKLYQVAYSNKFLKSFGDWIKDPSKINNSKIDNNGEPLFNELEKFILDYVNKNRPKDSDNETAGTEIKDLNDVNNDVLDKHFPLDVDDQKPDGEFNIPGDLYDKIYAKVINYVGKLKDRQKFFETLQKGRKGKFSPSAQSIDRLELLIAEFGNSLEEARLQHSKGTLIQAYSKMLDEIITETGRISKYVNNPNNIKTEPYISVVLEGLQVIESYKSIGLAVDMGLSNSNVDKKMVQAQDMLDTLKDDLTESINDFMQELVKDKTTNKDLTQEDIQRLLQETYDINIAELNLADIANSPDTLLAIADRVFKQAQQETFDRHDEFKHELHRVGNLLSKLWKGDKSKMFDFMLERDDNGKLTGRYTQRIGKQFFDRYYKLKNTLYDKEGKKREYIYIKDVKTAKKEDLEHNIALQKDKKALFDFNNPEIVDYQEGIYSDGEYRKYNDEYKQERDKYMIFTSNGWEVKSEYEGTTDYAIFLNRYHQDAIKVLVAVKDKVGGAWIHQGRTEEQTMRFVKSEFIEIRDITSNGEDMRNPKWTKLQNPTTELEKQQANFYNFFIESYEGKDGALSKLPLDVRNQMIGKIPRVRMNLMDQVSQNKQGFLRTLGKSIRQWGRPTEHSTMRLTDEQGLISDGLPIFFTGDLQSQKRIQNLENKEKELKANFIAKKVSIEDYNKKKTELRRLLSIEYGKVSAENINTDLVNSLERFSMMSENYEVMSNIEDTIKAIAYTIENRKVIVKDAKGNILTKMGDKDKSPVVIEGRNSNIYKRMSKWMKMVYYNNAEVDSSTAAFVAKRIQNTTSFTGMGLNVFASINNYVMGRINNAIEAWGGQHFGTKEYFQATKEYNKYISGLNSNGIFAELKHSKLDKDQYKDHRHYSKYSAMVDHFRVVRKFGSGDGRAEGSMIDWAYCLQEGGEWNVQSKTGIAVLMTEKVKTKDGEISIWDAYTFDNNTGKLILNPNVEFTAEQRHNITNKIYEVNKIIHGNYAHEDRMVIQQHWLGQLGAQFHKWMVPAIKARFQKRYYNENLGDIEGRYITLASFFKYAFQLGFKFKSAYQAMDQNQKANLRKNLAEALFLASSFALQAIFSAIASGIPPEDKTLKRFFNFLTYQESRQINEIRTLIPLAGIDEQYQLAKSPLAGLKTIKDFGEAVWGTVAIPYDAITDNMRFERGVNKGELRWWKEWKDVIPGLKQMNRWDAFETVKNFYIK